MATQFLRITAKNSNPLELEDNDIVPYIDLQIIATYPKEADYTKVVADLTDVSGIAGMNAALSEYLDNQGFSVDTVNPDHPSGQYPPMGK